MNEYLKAFQSISSATDKLLENEYISLEIKKSATNLLESVQPCFRELIQSANNLNSFIQVSSTHLDYADKLWSSKPQIAEAPKEEIWQQIGEISGSIYRIRILASQCKNDSIKQAKYYWKEEIENLINQWFIDSKGQIKKGVDWSDKDKFNKAVISKLEDKLPLPKLINAIKEAFYIIYKEIFDIYQLILPSGTNYLDDVAGELLMQKINSSYNMVTKKYQTLNEDDNAIVQGFKKIVKLPLANLVKPRHGSLLHEEVINFKNEIFLNIENFINLAVDETVEVVIKMLEAVMEFDNEFLERQERYQQETPEQREAEKAWIDQQRQQLQQVQDGIEAILQFGGV